VDRSGSLQLLNVSDWKEKFQVTGRKAKANALAFSTDDRLLAVAWDDSHVSLLETSGKGWHDPAIALKAEASALAFCDSDRLLAIGTVTGEIQLWNIAARRIHAVIKGHTGRINALATGRGGKTLFSG